MYGSQKEIHMQKLPLNELRQMWSEAWGLKPHARIGWSMLEKSLIFKTQNGLTREHDARLEQLVKQYKRNPAFFDSRGPLKPGTRLIRNWKGKRHSVLVKTNGFEYQGHDFTSLSQIANQITGSRWNGHVFFNLRKKVAS